MLTATHVTEILQNLFRLRCSWHSYIFRQHNINYVKSYEYHCSINLNFELSIVSCCRLLLFVSHKTLETRAGAE